MPVMALAATEPSGDHVDIVVDFDAAFDERIECVSLSDCNPEWI
jgi:hypothetical protein